MLAKVWSESIIDNFPVQIVRCYEVTRWKKWQANFPNFPARIYLEGKILV